MTTPKELKLRPWICSSGLTCEPWNFLYILIKDILNIFIGSGLRIISMDSLVRIVLGFVMEAKPENS